MRIPEHIRIDAVEVGADGCLHLPQQLLDELDMTPGSRLMLRADTKEGTLCLKRIYGFVPQVLENDGISDEARQTVAEIMAAWTKEERE
ncbi:MAG: hypothetical protein IKC76_01210 [Firmicutes bacterium]|nr:hypothetical protein [Bacillota bacterium]MBR7113115.1 hypothetical protein [Bacillota bacterium]